MKSNSKKLNMKLLSLFILILIYTGLIFYIKLYTQIETVYSHFFYILIGITALGWGLKSIWTAIYLGILLNLLNYLFHKTILLDDLWRAFVFILFAYIVGILSAKSMFYKKCLKQSQQQMADIINFLPDATLAIDLEGKIITWNRAIEEMTGIIAKDIIGKGNYEYALPFYGERRPILVDLVLNDSEEIKQKYPYIRIDKDCIVAETPAPSLKNPDAFLWGKASPQYDANGNIVGAIESIRDISFRKTIEQESIKTSKLESISLLAGGIAHDFNNFLTVILGNVSLLKRFMSSQDIIMRLLSEVEKSALQSTYLTQQLLTFSKGGTPIKEIINISQILVDSVNLALSGSNARCEFNIPENLWFIEADKGQINQVINNLIINAYQSMPHGGTINLNCENITVETKEALPLEPGKYVKITIKDEGIGISEENLSKIFDPYFTTKQYGHGLGLSTAYSIIKRHGGYISIESNTGKGTSFCVYIPSTTKKDVLLTDQSEVLLYGSGNILVMDDDIKIRSLLKEILKYLGYKSDFASDGIEAIDLFIKAKELGEPYIGIIMDLTIPAGLGGKDTIAKLKDLDPDVKVIVSSGYSNDPIMADYNQYGFTGIIPKPYTIEKLGSVLKILL
ncbi:MAG: hybrid sensor histidine kinase/response regulator [Firmicutes bacterium HGW-Firmicutes-12]|nr:MAG: hybrid sensor histidine kinase/response regulator [Firmicutes bacterium HGW-Firmicutes-12]